MRESNRVKPVTYIHRSFWALLLAAVLFPATIVAQQAAEKKPPAEDPNKVIARVLGQKILAKDKDRMNGLIVGALMQKFVKDNKITVTEDEINTFVQRTAVLEKQQTAQMEEKQKQLREELKDSNLPEAQRKQKKKFLETIEQVLKATREVKERQKGKEDRVRAMKQRMAKDFVRHWKTNKALFAKYGGRVIFQQAGPEPVDAYRQFLEEQEQAGAFQILDPALKDPFWRYFTNDAMHNFYPKGEGEKFINTPWWTMDPPPLK